MIGRQVQCRCGMPGELSAVDKTGDNVDVVWVEHVVGQSQQTHSHTGDDLAKLLERIELAAPPGQHGPTADYGEG